MATITTRRSRPSKSRAVGMIATGLAVTLQAGLLPDGAAPVRAATVTVLDEDWAACTSSGATTTNVGTGGGSINLTTYYQQRPTCPNWTAIDDSFLSIVASSSSPPPAIGSQAIYLNEGGGTAPGKISRTLSGLTPNGFYEIIVFAWKDAGNGSTTLEVKVVSGSATTNYTMPFSNGSAAPQTIRLRFPVPESSATITLTGGTGSTSSPVVGTVKVESRPTVFFLPNGATGTMDSQSEPEPTALRSNSFVLEGCTFVEWQDAQGTTYSDGQNYNFSEDLVLTAQWSCPDDGPRYDIDIENYIDPPVLPNTL